MNAERVMTKAPANDILARCSDQVVLDVRENFAVAPIRKCPNSRGDAGEFGDEGVIHADRGCKVSHEGLEKDRAGLRAVPSTIARSATISSSIDADASSYDIRDAPGIAWPTLAFSVRRLSALSPLSDKTSTSPVRPRPTAKRLRPPPLHPQGRRGLG